MLTKKLKKKKKKSSVGKMSLVKQERSNGEGRSWCGVLVPHQTDRSLGVVRWSIREVGGKQIVKGTSWVRSK